MVKPEKSAPGAVMEVILWSCHSANEYSTQTSCFMDIVSKEFLINNSNITLWCQQLLTFFVLLLREPEPTSFKRYFYEVVLSVIGQTLYKI